MAKLSQLVKKYKGDLARIHRDSCLELSTRVIEDTPRDIGTARRSWIQNGPPVLGRIYSLTNSLDYIIALEYGHSDQAPNGMLRTNVRNWNQIVRSNV